MFDELHIVINSKYVQTLPTEEATSVVTVFFRGFMTPSLMSFSRERQQPEHQI